MGVWFTVTVCVYGTPPRSINACGAPIAHGMLRGHLEQERADSTGRGLPEEEVWDCSVSYCYTEQVSKTFFFTLIKKNIAFHIMLMLLCLYNPTDSVLLSLLNILFSNIHLLANKLLMWM